MSTPNSTAFLRPDLGQAFVEFDLDAEVQGFIGPRVLPIFEAGLQTANFSVQPLEELLADRDTERASGAGYSRSEGRHGQDSYACKEYGHEEPVDDRNKAIYAYSFDSEFFAARRSRNTVLRGHEIRVANLVFNTTTWSTSNGNRTNVSTPWSTAASATPVDDVLGAVDSVRTQCGEMPNAVIMDWTIFKDCVRTAQVVDQLKYNGPMDPAAITASEAAMAALAQLFTVDQVIVAKAKRNNAAEGATASLGNIWTGRICQVAKLAKSRDLKESCLGRTFMFNGDGASPMGTFEQYREEQRRADIIRYRTDLHEKLLRSECAHMLGSL